MSRLAGEGWDLAAAAEPLALDAGSSWDAPAADSAAHNAVVADAAAPDAADGALVAAPVRRDGWDVALACADGSAGDDAAIVPFLPVHRLISPFVVSPGFAEAVAPTTEAALRTYLHSFVGALRSALLTVPSSMAAQARRRQPQIT